MCRKPTFLSRTIKAWTSCFREKLGSLTISEVHTICSIQCFNEKQTWILLGWLGCLAFVIWTLAFEASVSTVEMLIKVHCSWKIQLLPIKIKMLNRLQKAEQVSCCFDNHYRILPSVWGAAINIKPSSLWKYEISSQLEIKEQLINSAGHLQCSMQILDICKHAILIPR